MMRVWILCLAGLLAGSLQAADQKTTVRAQWLNQVQQTLKIDLNAYPSARAEFFEHVEACGIGIVKGLKGPNKCSYTIALDDYFLRDTKDKTGYIHEPDWAYQEGVEFITVSPKTLEELPEQWDLADHGPMTDIHRQRCGDCWSTSSRKLLEQAMATHGYLNDQEELFQLSGQTTLSSCCRWCGSCNGGYMSTPNFFSVEGERAYGYGLPTRDLDPYRGSNTSCRFSESELEEHPQKLVKAPYVGSSLQHSRFFKGDVDNGQKVKNTMALMMKYRSNALVTISAIGSDGGIIKRCSNINSGGNHMQNIVGWYQDGDETIARVQNSWGTDHGQDGYTHIRWECGHGRLNRGLGRSTRVGIIDSPLTCSTVADAFTGPNRRFRRDSKSDTIRIGRQGRVAQTCEWFPKSGIVRNLSADGCEVEVSPEKTTEYHVVATDQACGSVVSSMVLVTPLDEEEKAISGQVILTPHGEVTP